MKTKPARLVAAGGPRCYLERDLVEARDRLEPEPERLELLARVEPDRLEAEPERFAGEPEREDAEREDVEREDAEPEDVEREDVEREAPDREALERLDAGPERALLAREPELRDPLDARLEPFDELRERLDARREVDRDVPLRRSAAGISSLATAFASCAICFSRNLAIRSSSRRMPRASLAVSLSLTASASASMPV